MATTASSETRETGLMYEITYNPKFILRRAPKVNVKTVVTDGEKTYFMKDHATGSLYFLSEFGYDVWNLIDDKRTTEEVIEAMADIYKDLEPDMVKEALLTYAQDGVLEGASKSVKGKRFNIVSAFMIRLTLVWKSGKFLQSVHRRLQPLLKKPLLWLVLIFVAAMGLLFSGTFVSVFARKENFEIMGSTVIGFFFYYFMILAPIILVHEIAHGLALVHYGGEPGEMGAGLYFFGPMFYAEVTDAWTLTRSQRIMIYAAGPLATVTIGSAIMVLQSLWQFPPSISLILTMATFFCFYGLLVDLSPLLETDGYNILCDGLNIPDLRAKSFNYIKTLARKLTRRPAVKEDEDFTRRRKMIFIVYAVSAALWAMYLIYRTLTIAAFMAQDTTTSVLNVSTAVLFNNPVTAAAVGLSIASVLYFSMTVSGYFLILYVAMKKATKKILRLEDIRGRGLSVFLYLPKDVSKSLFNSLKSKIAKTAKSLTHDFAVSQTGSMCVAVLKMSGTKLAVVQIREHFRSAEKKFSTIYQSFLRHHRNEILESVGIVSPRRTSLAALLSQMSNEASSSGSPEAKSIVSQVVDRQIKDALYLLNSAYGTVWTLELSPTLLHEVGGSAVPTLLPEDILMTDLYEDTEEFKKKTIYGFDSLAKLSIENQTALQEALLSPEKYHVIMFLEPVKSRLIFLGRTEEIERVLDSLGNLFVCQIWCGYLDNLLSDINFSLLALNNALLPTPESVVSMQDGELSVLDGNLSRLMSHEETVSGSLKKLKNNLKCANLELDGLRQRLEPNRDFKLGLIDTVTTLNGENLAHLPSQFDSFRTLSQELFTKAKRIARAVKKEHDGRKEKAAKRKRQRLSALGLTVALSTVLALVGVRFFSGFATASFLASALLVQIVSWAAYLRFSRSLKTVTRYSSLAFRQVHFFTFAFVESLYKFTTATSVLTPIETRSSDPDETSSRKKATKKM